MVQRCNACGQRGKAVLPKPGKPGKRCKAGRRGNQRKSAVEVCRPCSLAASCLACGTARAFGGGACSSVGPEHRLDPRNVEGAPPLGVEVDRQERLRVTAPRDAFGKQGVTAGAGAVLRAHEAGEVSSACRRRDSAKPPRSSVRAVTAGTSLRAAHPETLAVVPSAPHRMVDRAALVERRGRRLELDYVVR